MSTTIFSGGLSWILNFCVLVTVASILITGTWIILNYFVWDILVVRALKFLNLYKIFVHFIIYRKRYFKWAKKYEGKLEEGAND